MIQHLLILLFMSLMAANGSEQLTLRGYLRGHEGSVTSIATNPADPNMILSGSRDKSINVWQLTRDEESYGFTRRALTGHSHFVSDVVISSDGQFALSASWDKTLRLWDLNTGVTSRTFVGHTSNVLSVAFSTDNRQIVSAGRDKTIKLWNKFTGKCKYTVPEAHSDWITAVRFSPNSKKPMIISASLDKKVKVWDLKNMKLIHDLSGHQDGIQSLTVSPDGSIAASGDKSGTVMLWNIKEGKLLDSYETKSGAVNALVFAPNRDYGIYLAACTDDGIIVWGRHNAVYDKVEATCQSIAFSNDGSTLFTGWTDKIIRVLQVES